MEQSPEGLIQLTFPAMNRGNASVVEVAFYNNDTGLDRKLKIIELNIADQHRPLNVSGQRLPLARGRYAAINETVDIERELSDSVAELVHGDVLQVPIN